MADMLFDLLVRVTGVLVVATMVATAVRRASASVRALTWTAGLVGALVLPLIALFAPPVPIGVLATESMRSAVDAPAPTPTISGESQPFSIGGTGSPATRTPEGRTETWDDGRVAPDDGLAPDAGFVPDAGFAVDAEVAVDAGVPVFPLLLSVWALTALLFLLRLLVSHNRLSRLGAGAAPAGAEWIASVESVRLELGIRRRVDVRTSRELDVPAVAGLFRPVLLLPESSVWTASARRDVTLHELAHVARWDAIGQLVSQVACAIYWFIPFTWYAAQQAAALREQACDNVVLNAGTRPSAYAERLLTLARTPMTSQLEPVALAMARPARIHGRVLGILDPTARRTRLSAPLTTMLIAFSLAIVALVAVVEPVAASAPSVAVAVAPSPSPADVAAPVTTDQGTSVVPAPLSSSHEPLPQQPDALCARGIESNSMHRNSDDGDEYWRLTAKGPGCDISVRVEGEPRFNDDFTDIVAISGRGIFEVDARVDGVRRELRLRDDDGRITRTWRVDGREAPYDAAAAAWFARFLIGLDRQTGFAVDVRLPRLLERGGVVAVLDETRNMSSDYVRSVYYQGLAKERQMTPQELVRLLNQEAELNSSDFYAAELLKGVARQGLGNPVVRDGVMRLIAGMDSDYHKSESIKATVHAGRPTNDEVALLIDVVGTMDSDFHKAETVKLLMDRAELTPDQLGDVLSIASDMSSDFHITGILSSLADGGTLDAAERRAYLTAARDIDSDFHRSEALKGMLANGAPTAEEMDPLMAAITEIDSDHHKGEVLGRLLDVRSLREADLLRAQAAARTLDSDFNQAEVLRRIARHPAATAKVRDAVYEAAGALSRHYRDEVRRAVGR